MPIPLRNLLFLLHLVCFCSLSLFAGGQDTVALQKKMKKPKIARDSTIVSFLYNDFEKIGLLNMHAYDTALSGFQNYDPQYKKDRFSANLGNVGSNSRDLVPYPFMRPSGWDFGIHSFDLYMYRNDSVKYYKIYKTFTEVSYFQGPK